MTDYWNTFTGDWNLDYHNWSFNHPPTLSEPAEINSGTVTISTTGAAYSLRIDRHATLTNAAGTSLSIAAGFLNYGTWNVGSGVTATIGETLTNSSYGGLNIGNASLSASTTVEAGALANTGALIAQGNAVSGTTNKASLIVSGAAPSSLTGSVRIGGDAALQFGTGQITTIASGTSLELDGSGAQVLTDGGASSALSVLTKNDGLLTLQGHSLSGAGGATLTTSTGLTNGGAFNIDTGTGYGGSAVRLGGVLTNSGALDIGNTGLSASTTVKATTLVNTGALVIQGNAASGTTSKASLILSGAAPSTLTGSVRVGGDATLQFGSGDITTIASGASLELDGSGAQVLTGGGASSALSVLTENDGTLTLQGSGGAGGATLTTSTGLTNGGTFNIDTGSHDGGSAVTLGGTLTNSGELDIGNSALITETMVTTEGLTNSGSIALLGHGLGPRKAELIIHGDATTSGTIDIGLGAMLRVTVGNSFTQDGGSSTVEGRLLTRSIDVDSGVLDFKSAIFSGELVGALNIGATGRLEFDAAVDATHGVDFAAAGGVLALGDAGQFGGTVSNFAFSDAIDLLGQGVTGLAYSGTNTSGILTVDGSSGAIAHLSLVGDYTTSSFTFGSDGHGGSEIRHT